MRKRFGHTSLVVATALLTLLAACSDAAAPDPTAAVPASEAPTTTGAPTAVERTSTTSVAAVSTSSTRPDEATLDSAAAVAAGFMAARDDRDLETALTYLDREVVFEWGPGSTYDTLELGWAWEDAFALTHTTDTCKALSASGDTTTVVCRIKVDSEVAAAVGNSPGYVCATISVVNELITHLAVEEEVGCSYSYWPNMFVPFEAWLRTAHPDATIHAMYDDRISEAGLRLWTEYTEEFLAARG